MRLVTYGDYPSNWAEIATAIKDEAEWRCVRCSHDHDSPAGYCLTVHHWDGNKANCVWWNCLALCQRCHLSIQGRVSPDRPWVMLPHSDWFRPYVAGFYAKKYLGLDLTREEAMARIDDLLGLEVAAVSR